MKTYFSAPMIEKKGIVKAAKVENDWTFKHFGIRSLWREYSKGVDTKIAILDSGINSNHPNLKKAITQVKDFTNQGLHDDYGHGTRVASIISGQGISLGGEDGKSDKMGIAPESRLIIGKVLDKNGDGTSESFIDGIKWAISEKADIINISFDEDQAVPSHKLKEIRKLIKKAINKNIIVVCGAGNNGRSTANGITFPGNIREVITVGSVKKEGAISRSNFSNMGRGLDIMAPGQEIYVSCNHHPNKVYPCLGNGTSYAVPFVVGSLALIIGFLKTKKNSFFNFTPKNAKDLLKLTATKTSIEPIGLIDVKMMLEIIKKFQGNTYIDFINTNKEKIEKARKKK